MNLLPILAGFALLAAQPAAQANPCANGSFEELAPNGFPADWAPIGRAEVVGDARSGKRALRLLRTNEPPSVETGINGRNIDRLRGGIDFHYKALAAKDVVLHIYAIPIAADGIEKTGAPRAGFKVPKEHVGDGQWHHARLKYDFTKNEKVKTVIFAARLEGTSGELLLDDFSYVDRVGPMLRVGTIRLEEDSKRPGELCTVSAPVENAGDEPVKDVRVAIEAPKGLKAAPVDLRRGDIAPDGRLVARWTLDGARFGESRLKVIAASGPMQDESVLRIAPQVVVRSWGPASPVFVEGEPIIIECELANVGNSIARNARTTFEFRGDQFPMSAERLAPGQRLLLKANLPPQSVRDNLPPVVRGTSPLDDDGAPARLPGSFVTIARLSKTPPPSGALKAVVTEQFTLLENEHLRFACSHEQFVREFPAGVLPGGTASAPARSPIAELSVNTRSGWKRAAWVINLASGWFKDEGAQFSHFALSPDKADHVETIPGKSARVTWTNGATNPRVPTSRVTYELTPGAKAITARYELHPKNRTEIAFVAGPWVDVLDRDEAIFPGVEWLVADERSSDSVDIAPGHLDRFRTIVDPNWITVPAIGIHGRHGTVALLWNARQEWHNMRDRPGVYFGSPNRMENQRCHVIGMFLPNPPEHFKPNTWHLKQTKPYLLEAGGSFRLEAKIYADGDAPDALSAIDEWIKLYGFPKPAALPRGSYEKEIEFSMQAYLKSLWVPEEKKWWTSKGAGELLSPKGLPRSYVADLLVGELLSPDPEIKRQCRARAEEVLAIIGGGPGRLDVQRFPGHLDSALASSAQAASLLMSRDKDGAWRFDADQVGQGPFVGMDYHELGPDNAAELGTCAAKATAILRYARITGDWEAYRAIVKTLEFMERFRVPRAAQVWEVPVHSPDILAAAEAVEAYLEAYRFSGEKRWLRNAVTWARRGLPFVYLWDDPQKPFLVGASIPVFGASWMQASWFGRPVQWNGLRYAEALLDLAEHDQSYPWRQLATALTHSAIHQQDKEGENVALWPDSIGAVQGDKSAWVFAPRAIITNILTLMGRDEHIRTTIVGAGERRLHISANAAIGEAKWDGAACAFRVTYPAGEQGTVVVFNIVKPQAVTLDGKALTERAELETGTEAGWRYDSGTCCLSIRVPKDGSSAVRVEGAAFRSTPRLPQPAGRIAFEFAETPDGWMPMHDMSDVQVRDGVLASRITGGDPYLARIMLRVRGDDCPAIAIRMRATAGGGGQLFWMTEASPAFTEDKSVPLGVRADGQFHEYRLEVGKHPAWSGQTITGLRIDPTDGGAGGEFAVEYVRGTK